MEFLIAALDHSLVRAVDPSSGFLKDLEPCPPLSDRRKSLWNGEPDVSGFGIGGSEGEQPIALLL